tara:strand:+ start:1538 stop:1738 length:201 start_codon:yes stop_codon:yes gene_type:complete
MGKMKELYQAMKECDWQGTPEDYLKWWIKDQAKKIDKKNENNTVNKASDTNFSSIDNNENKSNNKK